MHPEAERLKVSVGQHLDEVRQETLSRATETACKTLFNQNEALKIQVELRDTEIARLRERLAQFTSIAEEAPTGELPKYSQFDNDPED